MQKIRFQVRIWAAVAAGQNDYMIKIFPRYEHAQEYHSLLFD